MSMSYTISSKTWCEISAAKLRSNFAALSQPQPSHILKMAVVKSNAYGHGIVECSKIFDEAGCDWFGVDDIDEALLLRAHNITKPILVLGATLPYRLDDAKKYDITITCSTFELLQQCKDKEISIHIKIDTGLGRQGFTSDTFDRLLNELTKNPDIVTGIYSHLAAAELESQDEFTNKQYEKLITIKEKLENVLGKNILHHIAASAGSMLHKNLSCEMVRFGISLYGLWPSPDTKDRSSILLDPVLTWKSRITEIKHLPKNHTVGYDRTHTLGKDSTIAVVPVGYWHGVSRDHSSNGFVIVGGKKASIIGRVSMDMITVDVTGIENVSYGDEVIIIGNKITAEEFAVFGNTINYEAVTCINPLIERRIV